MRWHFIIDRRPVQNWMGRLGTGMFSEVFLLAEQRKPHGNGIDFIEYTLDTTLNAEGRGKYCHSFF